MDLIFPQPGRVAPVMPATAFPVGPAPALAQPDRIDRIDRLAALTPEDKTAGLVWVALHAPATYDAMLDALEADARDDAAAVSEEPEPYCLLCDAPVGIFLAHGSDYRHYRGVLTATSKPRPYKADHPPVIAWRPARAAAIPPTR